MSNGIYLNFKDSLNIKENYELYFYFEKSDH